MTWQSSGLWMVLHMGAAMLLGWIVGYERYFSGRAAGSQVYCLVCATSCAVTLLSGYPSLWYWGSSLGVEGGDPTRVIGSVLTGIGFLGAGIIVQSGLNVRGLTTAASIWGSSAIGILVGVGFYIAAMGLTALFVISMVVVPRIERLMPAHAAIAGTLHFREGYRPRLEQIHQFLSERGLSIPSDSLAVTYGGKRFELRCLIVAASVLGSDALGRIAVELSELPDVDGFTVTHSSRA